MNSHIGHTVAPTHLRDYLKVKGWHADTRLVDRGLYGFKHQQYAKRQLVFPIDQEVEDYDEMVTRLVRKLAQMENRTADAIWAEFHEMAEDTVGFRIASHEEYIPLQYAIDAMNGAREMLLAAATTAIKPQYYHPRLSRKEPSQLLSHSKFRHTEKGSFVLKITTPVHSLEEVEATFYENTPYARQTTLVLNQGVSKLVGAIITDTLEDLLEDTKGAEKPIVTSNLCKAIIQFQEQERQRDLHLNFGWAKTLLLPPALTLPPVIKVQQDYYSRIANFGQSLRSQEEQQENVYIGTVEKLLGEAEQLTNRRMGEVILDIYQQEDQSLRARAELSADWHALAIEAYSKPGTYIRVKGKLLPGNQPKLLKNISLFEIIGKEPQRIAR